MRKSKQLLSTPVISIEEGQQIGFVKGLLIDPSLKQVVALIIEQKGWFKEQKFIPFSKINSIGEDAITINRNSNAARESNLPNVVKLLKSNVKLTGARIVSENGTLLGYVDEYYIDLTSGQLVGIELTGKHLNSIVQGKAFLDSNYIKNIGKEVIICTNKAVDNVIQIEGGIQETLTSIKDSTSLIWDKTMQRTRSIKHSLNKSLQKLNLSKERKTDAGKKEDDSTNN